MLLTEIRKTVKAADYTVPENMNIIPDSEVERLSCHLAKCSSYRENKSKT